jgi:hypothetical protein
MVDSTDRFRGPGTFSTGSAKRLRQRYSIRMPMKPLGTMRENLHLSKVEVVMIHKLMGEKKRVAKSLFMVRLSAIQKVMVNRIRGKEGSSYS